MPNETNKPAASQSSLTCNFISRLSKQDRLVFERLPICDKQYFAELMLEAMDKTSDEKTPLKRIEK